MESKIAKALLILTASAWGFTVQASPYIGAKTDRVMVDVEGISLDYVGVRAVGGYQVTPSLSLEGHMGTGISDTEIAGVRSELGNYYGVDLIGALPLNEQFSLFAKVGYGSIELDRASDNDIRYGVGAIYNLDKSTAISIGYERWFSKEGVEIDNLNAGVSLKF